MNENQSNHDLLQYTDKLKIAKMEVGKSGFGYDSYTLKGRGEKRDAIKQNKDD
jgi:hypothetical protein